MCSPHQKGVLCLWVSTCARISPSFSSQKENDNFNISKEDIEITLFYGKNKSLNCSFENITRNQDLTTIFCKIKHITAANSIATSSKKVHVSRPTVLPVSFTLLGGILIAYREQCQVPDLLTRGVSFRARDSASDTQNFVWQKFYYSEKGQEKASDIDIRKEWRVPHLLVFSTSYILFQLVTNNRKVFWDPLSQNTSEHSRISQKVPVKEKHVLQQDTLLLYNHRKWKWSRSVVSDSLPPHGL